MSKKDKRLEHNPWMTKGLLKSISKKRSLFKQFKNDRLKNKDSEVYQQYKAYTTHINKLKRICFKFQVIIHKRILYRIKSFTMNNLK